MAKFKTDISEITDDTFASFQDEETFYLIYKLAPKRKGMRRDSIQSVGLTIEEAKFVYKALGKLVRKGLSGTGFPPVDED